MVSLRNHFYTFMILHPVWDVLVSMVLRGTCLVNFEHAVAFLYNRL